MIHLLSCGWGHSLVMLEWVIHWLSCGGMIHWITNLWNNSKSRFWSHSWHLTAHIKYSYPYLESINVMLLYNCVICTGAHVNNCNTKETLCVSVCNYMCKMESWATSKLNEGHFAGVSQCVVQKLFGMFNKYYHVLR